MTAHPHPLDDVLQDLRITGSVLLHETYRAPWAIDIPDERRLRPLLTVGAGTRLVVFHFVRQGRFDLRLPGGPTLTVEAGDVVLCAGGSAHRMGQGRGARPVSIETLLQGRVPRGMQAPGAEGTELICGAFQVRAAPLNPLLGALPDVMTVSTTDATAHPMLAGAAWMLAHEAERGALGGYATGRILELLCAEAVRAHLRRTEGLATGWFKGLNDERVAQAMQCVHAEPARAWSVGTLAGQVALSPSRLAARFKASTGMAVMTYVARWRANMACRLLTDSGLSLTQVAHQVGYGSLPAFSRAFKAQVGQAPAAWRTGSREPAGRAHLPGG